MLWKLWRETAKDPDVKLMASKIEVREAAHCTMLRKRVQDLCGGVDPFPVSLSDAVAGTCFEIFNEQFFEKQAKIFGDPNLSDKEKFEKLGNFNMPEPGKKDNFSDFFDDKTLDNETAGLLGWYIASERMSAKDRVNGYRKLTGQPPVPEPAGKSPYEEIAHLKRFRFLAKAEAGGEKFYKAWADTCQDPELIPCLRRVEMREREHSIAFRKRVQELSGADPYPDGVPPQKEDEGRMAIALNTTMTDKEKFEKLKATKPPRNDKKDVFCDMFTDEKDHDLASAIVLGRFIAEERASGWDSAEAYAKLLERSKL